ncbi:MAG: class I poly(R)-hydroxyalkanoic acid synthase [Gammaproteobacteria bacterium]|nr:class I poly(R)-hydroxyalkanoic acid synthase [Gammaproteobacteria bacterium]
MDSKDPNVEFFNYLNTQTTKMLAALTNEQSQPDFTNFNQQWAQLTQQSLNDPNEWVNTIANFQQQQLNVWNQLLGNTQAKTPQTPDVDCQQFQQQIFEYVKKSYLITSNVLNEMASQAQLDTHEKAKLEFYTNQYTQAMSPDNFAMTNPEVIQQAVATNGQSLVDGLKNLMADIEKGRISMTDESAFTLGENLAITEGAVVFENELFQLIHYKPQQDEVFAKPTLIVPPCINKYYILDLQPDNSFVKYCVDQGQNTFLISWANPTKEQGELSWDDYVDLGVINAINIVKDITDTPNINTVSWCVGGTLLASALAVLKGRKDKSVNSATFLTTLLDFEQPGEISVFIDQQQIEPLLAQAKTDGVLSGRQLATAFNMLRSRDLIWSYVVNNYLKGKQPAPFDILYWNGDSTNLPYQMYKFYINEMYLNNNFIKPNGVTLCQQSIDLSQIDVPCYFLSTIGDHIAPWKSTFKGVETFSGNCEFVLGASGHVAGVINSPVKNKRHFWVNGDQENGADNWLESATKKDGSWWPHWQTWLKKRAGKKISAPAYGNSQYQVIEPAPGRYVKVTLDDMK